MNDKNEKKLEMVKGRLDDMGVFYEEHANGQLKIDHVNLWVTTEKWYDEKRKVKGQGINSFMKHMKDNGHI